MGIRVDQYMKKSCVVNKTSVPQTVLAAPSPAALRDELEQLVLLDLLGPAGGLEEEVNESSVQDRYLVGMLAPSYKHMLPEEQEELELAESSSGEDGTSERSVLTTPTFNPSSLGMSFCVDGAATALHVTARWGRYQRVYSETLKKATTGAPEIVWKRQPMGGECVFPLQAGPLKPWAPEPDEQPEVEVQGLIRQSSDTWTVTLFLVNGQREPKRNRDEAWLFQPELIVESPDGRPIFQRRTPILRSKPSDEELTMAMLYREYASFAIGHGVGVHAEIVAEDPTQATRITTSVVPHYEVPRTESPYRSRDPRPGRTGP